MPIHDWSRAPVGLFHHFHQTWSVALCDALNGGALPEGYFALIEQSAIGFSPDVLTLRMPDIEEGGEVARGGIAVADAPPRTRFVSRADEAETYTAKANRVVVRKGERVVTSIEIVSPGNKDSARAITALVEKSIALLV